MFAVFFYVGQGAGGAAIVLMMAAVPWAPIITLPTFGQISPQRATGKHQPLPHTVCVAIQNLEIKKMQ